MCVCVSVCARALFARGFLLERSRATWLSPLSVLASKEAPVIFVLHGDTDNSMWINRCIVGLGSYIQCEYTYIYICLCVYKWWYNIWQYIYTYIYIEFIQKYLQSATPWIIIVYLKSDLQEECGSTTRAAETQIWTQAHKSQAIHPSRIMKGVPVPYRPCIGHIPWEVPPKFCCSSPCWFGMFPPGVMAMYRWKAKMEWLYGVPQNPWLHQQCPYQYGNVDGYTNLLMKSTVSLAKT